MYIFDSILTVSMPFVVSFLIILWLLLAVAFYTLAERKVLAGVQRREGPNLLGYWGFLQPLADGLKLLIKEAVVPNLADRNLFQCAPVITLFLSFAPWCVIPFSSDYVLVDLTHGLLFLFVISTLAVHGVVLAGWASNSKYAFLGAVRSAAQMISYDVSMGFIYVVLGLCVGSFNLIDIVLAQEAVWFVVPLFPLALIFFISAVAETNRAPFDLPEAESELVAGYNVEYGSMMFALFFLGEYANMLLMCALTSLFFLGGWFSPFSFLPSAPLWLVGKILILAFLYVLIRAALPRFRYDLLMNLGWLTILPIIFALVLFYTSLLWVLDGLPLRMDTLAPFAKWAGVDVVDIFDYYAVGGSLRIPLNRVFVWRICGVV